MLLFLICPALLALLLSAKLAFAPKEKTAASKVLGGFFFLFLIVFLAMILVSRNSELESVVFLVNLFSLLFYVALIALPPTVYFYTLCLTKHNDSPLNVSKLLPHYYPSILLFLINSIAYIYFQITTEATSNDFTYTLVENVMSYSNLIALIFIFPIANIYYIFKSLLNYKNHKKAIAEFFSYDKGISLKWVLTFLIGYICFIFFIYFIQLSSASTIGFLSSLVISLYLGFIGYQGDRQSLVLIEHNAEVNSENTSEPEFKNTSETASTLAEEEKHTQQKEELLQFMRTKQPYLDSKLTIQKLSRSLKTNNKYLSSLINKGFDQNFMTFINSYRVEEAKRLLLLDEYNNYTIETIAQMAGFHTKSSFNAAFKNLTGLTPSKYKKQNVKLEIIKSV